MVNPKIVKEWLDSAKEDYGFACTNLSDPENNYFGFICFHFQQAAEKYLKAHIIAKELKFEKIHDLDTLRLINYESNQVFDQIKDECIFLNDFYIETRYPAIAPSYLTRKDAEQAKSAVEKIAHLVTTCLEKDQSDEK